VLQRYFLNCFNLVTFALVIVVVVVVVVVVEAANRASKDTELNYRHIEEQIFFLNHFFLLIIVLFVLFVTWCDLFLLCPFCVFF
jgi:high-affinity Fe2+/Pb2+ permease